jgi:hypothetical protein
MKIEVTSSMISSAEYDEETQDLDIYFSDGKIYRFNLVPLEIVKEFKNASSQGKYFNANIKGKYRSTIL